MNPYDIGCVRRDFHSFQQRLADRDQRIADLLLALDRRAVEVEEAEKNAALMKRALTEIAEAQLQQGRYHDSETYWGLSERMKGIAQAALATTKENLNEKV